MKKELEIKQNILNEIYNIYLNEKFYINDYSNFFESIKNIIFNNAGYNNIYSKKDKQKTIEKSIKESKTPICQFIHQFKNYDVITNSFYMIFSNPGSFDFLNIEKTQNYNNIISHLYKTENEIIKDLQNYNIFNIDIMEVLSKFNFTDTIEIKNNKDEKILINKDIFIYFVCAMNLFIHENIRIYTSKKGVHCYCFNCDKIGVFVKI